VRPFRRAWLVVGEDNDIIGAFFFLFRRRRDASRDELSWEAFMRIVRSFVFVLAVATTLSSGGCGSNTVSQTGNPPPGGTGRSRLVVFGAGYCTICKIRFPEIQALLDGLPAGVRDRIDVELLVTAGDPASVRPTDALAAAYQARVGLKGTARADEWRWQTFRRLIGPKLEVPAAAVIDEQGRVRRVFTAGETSFVPQEIVAVAAEVAGAVR
jgi:hypothetical protein